MKHKWLLAGVALVLVSAMAAACFALHTPVKPPAPVPTPEECKQKLEEVRRMRADLARVGVVAFITNSALPQIAPHIHSKYWVDRLPIVEIERRDYEYEKREFGRDLVQQLEGCVFQDIRSMDTPTLEERSENLLLLAEWLSTSHGYGNYRLKRWAEHIALNGVVVLATRKEFAAAKIANYVARVAETDQNLPFRLDVLNEEAPHQFKLPVIRLGVDEGCLQAQWVAHLRETDRHYRELYKQGKIRRVSYCFSSVQHDDPVYAFYWDDCVGDATIGESWDKKRHYGFCVGDIDRDCKGDVKKVLRFREEVGVPLAPSSTECESQKAREAYLAEVERQKKYGIKYPHTPKGVVKNKTEPIPPIRTADSRRFVRANLYLAR